MINVFIPITSYSMLLSEQIIIQNKLSKEDNVLLNPHGFKYDNELWGEVYSSNISRVGAKRYSKKIINSISRLYQLKKFYKKVKGNVEKGSYNIYYVDLYHELSNHIFSLKKFTNAYIIEDGLLNYYDNKNTKLKLVGLKNFFFSLFGLSFRALTDKTHLTGIFLDSVTCQYVTYPEYSIAAHKSKLVSLEDLCEGLKIVENNILILGQEPIIFVGIEESKYNLLVIEMIELVLKRKQSLLLDTTISVFYKPHPRATSRQQDNLKKQIIKHFEQAEVNMVTRFVGVDKPIELIVGDIAPSFIVSFTSTSLITLKKMLRDRVEVYSYQPQEVKRISSDFILNLLKSLKIRIFEHV